MALTPIRLTLASLDDIAANGGKVPVALGGTNAATAAGARSALGLAIGTDVLAPAGDGSGLTGLNASALGSGTVPTARLPAYVSSVNGQTGAATVGTVTSVGLTVPGVIFTTPVAGSPITGAGTLALSLLTQAANRIFAGPATGADATPTFRSLTAADHGTGTANTTTFLRGDLTWAAPGGGGGSPGGSAGQVQFNSSGAFAGASGITYTESTGDTILGGSAGLDDDVALTVRRRDVVARALKVIPSFSGGTQWTVKTDNLAPAGLLGSYGGFVGLAFNTADIGTRDTTKVGGIFRFDSRTGIGGLTAGEQAFIIFGAPVGAGNICRLAVSLQDGTTLLAAGGGSVICNSGALATTATDGFFYIPTCAGTPTGTPTSYTGRSPLVIDSTGSKLFCYVGGAWKSATLA